VVPDKGAVYGMNKTTGAQLWRLPADFEYQLTAAGGRLAMQPTSKSNEPTPLTVLDPMTGSMVWQSVSPTAWHAVYQEAAFVWDCHEQQPQTKGCQHTARRMLDGSLLWTMDATWGRVSDDGIRSAAGQAAPTGPYVVAGVDEGAKPWALVDMRSGVPLPGRAHLDGWHHLPAGDSPTTAGMVAIDHDAPGDCAVGITAFDGRTGAQKWQAVGHDADGGPVGCTASSTDAILLAARATGLFAVLGPGDAPQALELSTGRQVWKATKAGALLDAGRRWLLVRDQADTGGLTLYDLATGTQRWTAPDPGLETSSASWASIVTDRLVAVSGADGTRPYVVVIEAETGRQLARVPGWLHGAGDDWVATTRTIEGKGLTLEFLRF
jgi:outer membrane protein assembly factor BamB